MEFNFKHISDGTIMKYVKQLENNKAVGHDGLSAKFIKLSGISLATSLYELFNRCVNVFAFSSEHETGRDKSSV